MPAGARGPRGGRPIGNAGNVTAVMEGFLDLLRLGMIAALPLIVGVQSRHANPVYLWRKSGAYAPVTVRSSVAQAAMIGNPGLLPESAPPRREHFRERFTAVEVTEQEIMDAMLTANRTAT